MAARARGADFSSAQTVAEVEQVAKTIDFAFIKLTQGVTYENPLFGAQAGKCVNAGIEVGVYHFLDPGVDGASQWDYFEAALVHWFGHTILVVALDYEAAGTTDAQARAFIRRGRQRGYRVGLYGGWTVTKRRLGQAWRWTAYWSQQPPPARWDVWQFTDGGGHQDYSVFRGDNRALKAWWRKQGTAKVEQARLRWWLHDELAHEAIGPLRLVSVGLRFLAYAVRHPRSRVYRLERK